MSAPTSLDLAIAQIFPKWGAERLRARREFSYEAARSTRLRKSATQIQGPEDYTAFPDRLQLIRNVRDLEQNFGLFQSIIDKLALYAFGKLRYQARTGNEVIDQQYEDYLANWFDTCDITGRHDFQQLVCIAFKSQLRDGDIGEKWHWGEDGLKLQGIEGDRIGGNVLVSTAENKFQGITVDLLTGKPITYDVYRRTKANAYVDCQPVPAADMMLVFDPRRIDQYRGITPFAPIVNEARDLKEVLEACLQGTKFENYHAAIGYTPSGQPLSDPSALITSTETDANGVAIKEQQLKYGMIQWAPSDAEFEFMKSDRPSGTFQTYVDMLIRLQGIALNLPYSFIYSMLGTGPAVRADLQQAHRTIEWHQANITKRLLNPAKNTALLKGIADGVIPYTPKWNKGKWQFAPAVSIDAGRDSAARVAERNAGLRSKDSIFAEDGEDAQEQEAIIREEVKRTLKTAKQLAEECDFDDDVVLTMLEAHTSNGFLFKTPEQPEAGDGGGEDKKDTKDAGKGSSDGKPAVDPEMMGEFRRLISDLKSVSQQKPIVIQSNPAVDAAQLLPKSSRGGVSNKTAGEFFAAERNRILRLKEASESVPARREAKAKAGSAVAWARQFFKSSN